MIVLADGGITLLQQPLVPDRLRLRMLDGDPTPLPVIAIEQAFIGLFSQHLHELFGEIERIVDATVEPHAADR